LGITVCSAFSDDHLAAELSLSVSGKKKRLFTVLADIHAVYSYMISARVYSALQ